MTATRSRVAVLGVASLVLCLTGCGGTPTAGPGTKATSPSASSTSSSSPQQPVDPCKNLKPATGRPAKVFGAKSVSAGYCELLRFTLEGSFQPALMQTRTFTPQLFRPFRAYLTPVARKTWDRDVLSVSASGTAARRAFNSLLAITYLAVTGQGYTLGNAQSARPVTHRTFFAGRASVANSHGARRLNLALKIGFHFNLTKKATGDSVEVAGTKTVVYTLEKNPVASKNKPWLIDGWRGTSQFGKVKPATGP